MLYVLEPSEEAHAVKGKRVRVFEDDDGHVSIRAGDVELPARAFAKEARARVTPGDVVADKHLGAVLAVVRAQQIEREEERLPKARTERERRLLKKRLKCVASPLTGHLNPTQDQTFLPCSGTASGAAKRLLGA